MRSVCARVLSWLVATISLRRLTRCPIDIMSFILSRLYYIDPICFRAVCKRWRKADFVKYVDKLPWLVAYNSSTCYLYDSSHKRTYHVSNSATREGKLMVQRCFIQNTVGFFLSPKRKKVHSFFIHLSLTSSLNSPNFFG